MPACPATPDLELAIDHDTSVLITTSHMPVAEQLARTIHARSRRAGQPFVTVNCHALGGNALDVTWRRRVAAASGGVLYIANLHAMTARGQARLARLLTVAPNGADASSRRAPRIIAGTKPTLLTDVARGWFPAALFYRLNVVHLRPE
jgi:DNA-binding NtrC family response regulator